MNVLLDASRAVADRPASEVLNGLYLGWALALLCDFVMTTASASTGRRGSDALGRLDKVIREGYAGSLSLTEMARRSSVSPQHLLKLCRAQRVETPTRQLYRRRVEMAAELLLGTGLAVAEIAERTGFPNPYHFSRKFRLAYGRAPLAWRKASWNRERKRR